MDVRRGGQEILLNGMALDPSDPKQIKALRRRSASKRHAVSQPAFLRQIGAPGAARTVWGADFGGKLERQP